MNIEIRKAERTNVSEIISLCAAHAEYEKSEYSALGKAEKLESCLFDVNTRFFCYLAFSNNVIVGYATCMLEFSTWDAEYYMHMDCLYVKPDYRSMGIGEMFIKHIATKARELGCKVIQWQTPVWNSRAIKFYHRVGAVSKEKLRMYLNSESL